MGQRLAGRLLLVCLLLCGPSCKREEATAPNVGVASLVPAATDMILAMGLGDTLVGVSNWEPDHPLTQHLPRVGDYRTIDWEQLSRARPRLLIVQFAEHKMPAGLLERASELGIEVLNVRLDRVADIRTTMLQLGQRLRAGEQAEQAWNEVQAALDEAATAAQARPRARVLIAMSAEPFHLVGRGTFINDLLEAAGGENVMDDSRPAYPTLDAEALGALDAEVVVVLLPGASLQRREEVRRVWELQRQVKAVREGRVHLVDLPTALIPGACVKETVRTFSRLLSDAPATGRSTG